MNHIKYSKADILKLEQELLEAIKSSNVNRLNALLHDDLLFVTPDGQTITKQMDLEAHRTKAMVVEEIKSDVEEITFIDNSA
ncbi:MAG: nuclear transport factor 2 family protein, partial [Chryseotalea sp.]